MYLHRQRFQIEQKYIKYECQRNAKARTTSVIYICKIRHQYTLKSSELFRSGSICEIFVDSPFSGIYILHKTNLESDSFRNETENLRINEMTSPRISTKLTILKN